VLLLVAALLCAPVLAQQTAAPQQNAPAQQTQPQLENPPEMTEPSPARQQAAPPPTQAAPQGAPAQQAPAAAGQTPLQQNLISAIEIHGNRRIPAETIRARIFTRPGDVYDAASLERDFNSLWNTGYFEDLRFEREESSKGWIIHVYVKEKPTIREIKYEGLNSVSQSDVLDRFKERKVSLTQESQFDPTKVKRAEVVIKELLAERGRQFATIRTEVRQIPPAAVGITFIVKEGPKVKVGKIKFEGNKQLSTRYLRSAMKNLKPIGIPHSIFLENIFARTYDATKLSEDAERVRMAAQQKGYFKVLVQDPQTKIRDTKPGLIHVPLIQKPGKRVDITIPVEEGDRYHLKEIKFTGYKAINNPKFLRSMFQIKDGDLFDTELIRKGLENLRKAYGEYGYINFTSVPDTQIDDVHKLITLAIDIDEGKQFYVRRIEFVGNTTTRDKVIRRELALEEGQVYNSRLWELSLLRLNQLGYFEPLKAEGQDKEQSSEIKQNNQEGTIDITLKVKEKGKNSIGLTGGVSGLAGSFIGLNYETNNFLGLGETLSVRADVGDRQRDLLFGFTEPYLFDRPLQLGFTVFTSYYDYNYAKELQIATNTQLSQAEQQLLESYYQNFSQSQTGFTVSASYPLRRSFKRLGLTYSFSNSSMKTYNSATQNYFEFLTFRSGISGPNALDGIKTSKFTPSLTFNTIDNPMHPTRGRSFFIGGDIAGLGGNVKDIRPVMEYKQFIPMKLFHPSREGHQVLGYRIQASFITGYGGLVAPPFERFYTGGDNDIRGFDIRSITPYAYITNRVDVPLVNPDDLCVTNPSIACTGVPKDPSNPRRGIVTIPLAVPQIVFTGGDTSLISNLEYRIPIAGPVTLAVFNDFGFNGVARTSQLQLSSQQVTDLAGVPLGCPSLDANFNCVGGSPITISKYLKPISGTNWVPRMSTGLELQVIMPVVNAPFRLYYAYNPLRLDTVAAAPIQITRDMFPAGGAGDITYQRTLATYGSGYTLREPRKTFRFTVSTTF
jgi:outer membrane protein insertion porin family